MQRLLQKTLITSTSGHVDSIDLVQRLLQKTLITSSGGMHPNSGRGFPGVGRAGRIASMDKHAHPHPCKAVVAWRIDGGVEGSHNLVPVTCADVVAALRGDRGMESGVVVKGQDASDSEEFAVRKELVIDPDKLEKRAREIYTERIWRPGQAPSWENVG